MKKIVNKDRKKIIKYAVLSVIILYVVYAIYLLLKQPVNKVTVENGTLYQEEANIGYIIRKEQVVKGNNYKNGMEQIINEGEKTAKNESIFRYYSQNEEELKKQISELDDKIQESLKGQTSIFSSDVKLLENQLDEKVSALNKLTDISKITEYKKQIRDIVTKKAKISGEKSAAGSYLKQLYDQRITLEEKLNTGAEYIKAPNSGIVSYKVDGLEDTLTPDNFSVYSKEFFENLKLKTGQLIATSDECGKIIDSSKCYIATISHSNEAKEAKIDSKVQVRLSNSKIIDANIVYISQENEDEMLLVLEIDKQISELANYRKISFDLVWWSQTGLKVPNQAIVEDNGLKYVVRNRAGYQSKILIKIKKQTDKYAIVSNYKIEELQEIELSDSEKANMKKIALYDELILNPDLSKIE